MKSKKLKIATRLFVFSFFMSFHLVYASGVSCTVNTVKRGSLWTSGQQVAAVTCTDGSGSAYMGQLTSDACAALEGGGPPNSCDPHKIDAGALASAIQGGMALRDGNNTDLPNPYPNSKVAGTAAGLGKQASGVQLACGQGPNSQTTIFGNSYKIVGNGIFLYDQSTKTTADTLVDQARGAGKPMLGMPTSGISDIAYVKYNKKLGWINCPLDSLLKTPDQIAPLLNSDADDDRCKPISGMKLTYTPNPNHPDPTKDNKTMSHMKFNSDGTAEALPCAADDSTCPLKSSSTDPQGMSFKMGADGNLSAIVQCPDQSGTMVAQQFIQNIGSGATATTKVPGAAGNTLPLPHP